MKYFPQLPSRDEVSWEIMPKDPMYMPGGDEHYKLVGESAVASGTRRVEAVTGTGSLAEFRRDYEVARLAEQVAGSSNAATPAAALRAKLQSQDDELKKLRRELEDSRMKSAASATGKARFGTTLATLEAREKDDAGAIAALDASEGRDLPPELIEKRALRLKPGKAWQGRALGIMPREWPVKSPSSSEAMRKFARRTVPCSDGASSGPLPCTRKFKSPATGMGQA